MRVAVVMPIYQTPIEWQRDALAALEVQMGRGKEFTLSVIRVFREKEKGVHGRANTELETIDLSFSDDYDRPTAIEQCRDGLERANAEGFDYAFCVSSNDVYVSDYVSLCLKQGKMVAYGDIGLCDKGLEHNRMIGTPILFDPIMIAKRERKLSNYIPDCAMVSMRTYRKMPIDTRFRRNSFHVWWLEIWERFGSEAFGHIGKVAVWMRGHDYAKSIPRRNEYMEDGARLAADYLKGKPWVTELWRSIRGGAE